MDLSNTFPNKLDSVGQLKTYQVGAVEAAAHRAMRHYKDTLLRDYGLTGVEWYIVGAVADAGPGGITSTELSKMFGTTMGFPTKTVKLLEAKGLVIRVANNKDARSNYICFNESKRNYIDEIEVALRVKLRDTIYSKINHEDLLTYIKVTHIFSQLDHKN